MRAIKKHDLHILRSHAVHIFLFHSSLSLLVSSIYIYKDVRIPDGVPRIISDELFEEVQEITRKRKHGHRPAIEDYLLSGKLFCGHCKDPMDGVSGTPQLTYSNFYFYRGGFAVRVQLNKVN